MTTRRSDGRDDDELFGGAENECEGTSVRSVVDKRRYQYHPTADVISAINNRI